MIPCHDCYTEVCLEVGALLAHEVVSSHDREALHTQLAAAAVAFHAALDQTPLGTMDYPTSLHRFVTAVFIGGHPNTVATATACLVPEDRRQQRLFPPA